MIQVAILGFGVVGSGTVEVLTENKALIEKRIGCEFEIKYILDLRDFPGSPFASKIVHDFKTVLNDPEVSVVAEMMGGSHPAYEFTKACLEAGKSVVTSNKEVVANFGTELLQIARAHSVGYLFEASVGGGIPIIRPMQKDLAANRILSVSGILNGTTNYILTQMKDHGVSFASALAEAQKLGYAEANPAADVEGLDAARKIVILAAMAWGKSLKPEQVLTEGITKLTEEDTLLAVQLGCTLKLIGHAEMQDGKLFCRVSPRMVRLNHPLSSVNDVFNGIFVDADMLGKTMFYGRGAGKLPTASAVVADILDCMTHPGGMDLPVWEDAADADLLSADQMIERCCFVFAAKQADAEKLKTLFGADEVIGQGDRLAVIGQPMTNAEAEEKIKAAGVPLSARFRMME